ncbi:hypothetical protein J4H86_25115 [Spiractinospora alimapuensis]|uniref:hypothetical protein n=1 Tax=Spiractinospora alimapuensis TaxID=2820884 RepID=UPI001F30215B|nr:hypothetical protein [Spiractinospora alimapuensis]QVQ51979.1 hypothetical protein J4H86_25115 [Spiractinospora alimapuensis]
MTYFSVLVTVKEREELDAVVSVFDAARRVAPHRRPLDPRELANARAWARSEETRAPGVDPDQVDDHEGQRTLLAAYLGEPVDLAHVDGEPVYSVTSSANPDGRLSSWTVGGGFSHTFRAVDPAHPDLVRGARRRDKPPAHRMEWVDGGPKWLLDLEATRSAAASYATELFDRYTEIASEHPPAEGMSAFLARHEADPEGYPRERLREEYHAQPLVGALDKAGLGGFFDCPIDIFAVGRDSYLATHRDAAIPAWALVTLEREWVAPGEIGRFGTSTESSDDLAAYQRRTNAYLDALPDDAWLIQLECHN